MLFNKNITFIVIALLANFKNISTFEYPSAKKEYIMGRQAGARVEIDPCAFAGTICEDAYYDAKHEARVEKRIYDLVRYSRS